MLRSHDLASAFVCLAAVVVLLLSGPLLLRSMSELLREQLSHVCVTADDVETQVMHGRRSVWAILQMLGPWLLFVSLAAFGIQIAQTGWLWVPQKIAPNLQRVAPGRGLQRLLEPAQFLRLLMLTAKLISVLGLAGWLLWRQLPDVLLLAELPTADLLKVGAAMLMRMTLWIGLGLVLLGMVDYAWQRWRYERDLCMAPEDSARGCQIRAQRCFVAAKAPRSARCGIPFAG